LAELAARLIKNGVGVEIYDPYVFEAYAANNSTAGRGNDVIPDLKERMVEHLDQMINDNGAILVGNYYKGTIGMLEAAAKTRPVLDLTRMKRDMVSDGHYQGICW
jgi:GDP-mannose 6-dehydrogenase